jgi:hypothetical protein
VVTQFEPSMKHGKHLILERNKKILILFVPVMCWQGLARVFALFAFFYWRNENCITE